MLEQVINLDSALPQGGIINGKKLFLYLWIGSDAVRAQKLAIDEANFFPVPDRDTGSNLAATLQKMQEELSKNIPLMHEQIFSPTSVMNAAAEGALFGSIGNSGTIWGQFLCGTAEALQKYPRPTWGDFLQSLQEGSKSTYQAVSKPVYGTLLTILEEWTQELLEQYLQHHDLAVAFQKSLTLAKKQVFETYPQYLAQTDPGPKKIDAGALALIYFLQAIAKVNEEKGFKSILQKFSLTKQILEEEGLENFTQHSHGHAPGEALCWSEIPYAYCTECLLEVEHPSKQFSSWANEQLLTLGDSLVVAGTEKKKKIHIHTNDPSRVFQILKTRGKIISEKIDAMRQQTRDASKDHPPIAIVVDSSCDLPAELLEVHNVHVIAVNILFGSESYLDKLTLNPQEFYQQLLTSPHHPTTGQPSIGAFKRTYEQLVKYYEHVISLHLPQNLSGTFQNAQAQASKISKHIHVVDTFSSSVGLGLIVLKVAELVKEKVPAEKILLQIIQWRKNMGLFICLPGTKYLARGGRINKVKGLVGQILPLRPILKLNISGNMDLAAGVLGKKWAFLKIQAIIAKDLQIIQQQHPGRSADLHFGIAHANDLAAATELQQALQATYPAAKFFVTDLDPALGVHGGPGSLAIAFLWDVSQSHE